MCWGSISIGSNVSVTQVKLDAVTLQRNVDFACNRPSERHVRDSNAAASRGEVEELECERGRAENKKPGVQPRIVKQATPSRRKGVVLVRRRGACRRPQEKGRRTC